MGAILPLLLVLLCNSALSTHTTPKTGPQNSGGVGCKKTKLGEDYTGSASTTKSGYTCQRWDEQTPHKHNSYKSDKDFPDGKVSKAANYCRNPQPVDAVGLWCYTTNPRKAWEECDVPECKEGSLDGGAAYIRWGRTSCPYTASTVYSGYTAGSHYRNVGGTVDYLCLHHQPQFWSPPSKKSAWKSSLYGTQYEFGVQGDHPFNTPNLHNQDAPCALCIAQNRRMTSVVIPARRECPPGWTLEYRGYMVSQSDRYDKPTRALCLDEDPERLAGGAIERNEALLYPMRTKCGILPCPPYADNELTCVVCTI